MTSKEIRASFLKYFERNGHRIVASAPLVPHDDPTLLFTNAGMNQFKDVLLGKETREYKRATTAQKCMRVSGKHNDLDNVGPSFRHHTFFEMLGNFSFGDYFKREAIPFAWTLLTEEWKLPKDRLFATIFKGEAGIPRDGEAYDLWRKYLPADHIGELGIRRQLLAAGRHRPVRTVLGDLLLPRRRNSLRSRKPAAAPVAAWSAAATATSRSGTTCSWSSTGRRTARSTRCLPRRSTREWASSASPRCCKGSCRTTTPTPSLPCSPRSANAPGRPTAGRCRRRDVSMRVVADHMRAMTFLIADGVVPSNEHRGYVLRKIMRRAMRHGKHLGMKEPFLYTLVDTLVRDYGDAYPELRSDATPLFRVVRSEEDRFDAVLTSGLPRLEEALERAASGVACSPVRSPSASTTRTGCRLTSSRTRSRREDSGSTKRPSSAPWKASARRHGRRARSRVRLAGHDGRLSDASFGQELERVGDNVFRGYESTELNTQVAGVFDGSRQEVESLDAGQEGFVALSATPFYLEAGGQVSDEGTITGPQGEAQVTGVVQAGAWPRLHAVRSPGER